MRPVLVVRLGLVITALVPVPAGAEVIKPLNIVLTFGASWLLVGLGLLAARAAVVAAWRLLKGTKSRLLTSRSLKVVAVAMVVSWVVSVWFAFVLGTGRRVGVGGEAPMIGDVRVIVAAQMEYARANGGFYDGDPTCLAEPARCIPGYSRTAAFLDRGLAAAEGTGKGYRRVFHPGPPLGPDAAPGTRYSRSSVKSFAVTSYPLHPERTGGRGICGDASGAICTTEDGSPPRVQDGTCVVAPRETRREGGAPAGCRELIRAPRGS